jgi:ATP-dependent Clp protease, protease subunit
MTRRMFSPDLSWLAAWQILVAARNALANRLQTKRAQLTVTSSYQPARRRNVSPGGRHNLGKVDTSRDAPGQDLNLARLPLSPRPRDRTHGSQREKPPARFPAGKRYAHSMSELILPSVTNQVTPADRGGDIYQRLLKERIVFLGTQVDDVNANLICAQLLLLAAEDPEKDISLYINSPGGSVTAGLAIYDTMQFVPCDVSTVCMGLAASMGQFLLCAGEHGKRFALPHSRILMHQPSGQAQGQAADIAIQAEQIIYLKRMMAEQIAVHTGQTIERIEADSDRDRWFTADEAKDYGFIDEVIARAERVTEPASA